MKDKYLKFFLILAILAFATRLYFAQYLTYYLDLVTFQAWSYYLVDNGFKTFYTNIWSDYLPGYQYILWFLGITRQWSIANGLLLNETILYKFPSIIADILNALLIFLIAKKFASPKKALFASLFFLINPAILVNSTFWGQADSFAALFIVLSFYLILQKKLWLAAIVIGFGQTVKPIAILSIPIYLAYIFLTNNELLRSKLRSIPSGKFLSNHSSPQQSCEVFWFNNKKFSQSFWQSFVFLVIGTSTFIAAFIPFNHLPNLFDFINSRLQQTFHQYPYTSLNAFNFWTIVSDVWIPDRLTFISISFQNWGNILFGVMYTILLVVLLSRFKAVENKTLFLSFILAICYLSMFIFLTRMHERHLLYGLVFISLLLPALSLKEILLILNPFIIYILNLLFAYHQLIQKPLPWDKSTIILISVVNSLSLVYFMTLFLKKYAKSYKS